MRERETIDGVPVTEHQIAVWVAEAETGYVIAALQHRGRGRYGPGAKPRPEHEQGPTPDEATAVDPLP